jgi:hypothetical protein
MGMLVLQSCVLVLEVAYPGAWLFLVPASLPFLNFSPWTGWVAFEELDLLLLAVLAGGYLRLALGHANESVIVGSRRNRLFTLLLSALALTGAVSFVRGVTDAGGWAFDWFGTYTHAVNTVRVSKSLVYALLLWPLMDGQLRCNPQRSLRLFALGMMVGLAWVSLAVLWDRHNFVGIFDTDANYRTVATFWEMHVGGAAIDAYLAMATPFAFLALASARRPVAWGMASALTLLAAYAGLTTFSRGVYLAVGLQLLFAIYEWCKYSTLVKQLWARWRIWGTFVVAVLVVMEIYAVLGGDSYMNKRLASSGQDMTHRLAHWWSGMGLLKSPADWLAGKGLGRLPANYSAQVPGENFSGSVALRSESLSDGNTRRYAVLSVPDNLEDLIGTFALTQRVDLSGSKVNIVQMRVRVDKPVALTVVLCQRYLLYDRDCQGASTQVESGLGEWQVVQLPLSGPPLAWGSIPITFAISLDTPGASADVTQLQVIGDAGQELLLNGDFSEGMAHWLASAQGYYVPWHIDNLYLEVLIERGVLGVLGLAGLILWAMVSFLLSPQVRGSALTATAAGLCGALVVGLVSSIMDVPRVALLFYLLPMLLIGKSNQR